MEKQAKHELDLALFQCSALIGIMSKTLSIHNHDRDFSQMTYVYPVISRRAGGVSIGINLNPNNACSWQCIYCQVPDLKRGSAPKINLTQLKDELDHMLYAVTQGDFMAQHVPEASQKLKDMAISGNGEPSSCQEINEVIEIMTRAQQRHHVHLPIVLISNGSFMHRPYMHGALQKIQKHGGEVWFKIDRANPEALKEVNGVQLDKDYLKRQITHAAQHANTWIQSCFFALDQQEPSQHDVDAYLSFLQEILDAKINISGVLLYGLARPSMQPQANRLSQLPESWMQALTPRIEKLGIEVKLSV